MQNNRKFRARKPCASKLDRREKFLASCLLRCFMRQHSESESCLNCFQRLLSFAVKCYPKKKSKGKHSISNVSVLESIFSLQLKFAQMDPARIRFWERFMSVSSRVRKRCSSARRKNVSDPPDRWFFWMLLRCTRIQRRLHSGSEVRKLRCTCEAL